MAWVLFLATLLSFFSGAHSQESLTQPASVSASPGQRVKLPCAITGQRYHFHWVRQRPGQHPQFVIKDNTQGEGISNRFTESNSGNIWYLIISDVQAEDEADYYCVGYKAGANQWIFGGGTQLFVTDQPASPPTMHLFPPSPEEIRTKGKATLVCLVDGFNPPDLTVTWQAGGTTISNGVETTKPTKHNNSYMASSYLTLTPSEWERNDYTVKVTHKGSEYVKRVSHSQCP